jgi:hypothetical protein
MKVLDPLEALSCKRKGKKSIYHTEEGFERFRKLEARAGSLLAVCQ